MMIEMNRKTLAVLLAVSVLATSFPFTGGTAYAQEVIEVTGMEKLEVEDSGQAIPAADTAEEDEHTADAKGKEKNPLSADEQEGKQRTGEVQSDSEKEGRTGSESRTGSQGMVVFQNDGNNVATAGKLGIFDLLSPTEAVFLEGYENSNVIHIPTYILVTGLNGQETAMEFLSDPSTVSDPNIGKIYKVTSIDRDCFKEKYQAASIEIPNTITSDITYDFFEDCENLSNIGVYFVGEDHTYGRYYDGGQVRYDNAFQDAMGVLIDCTKSNSATPVVTKQKVVCCPRNTSLTRYVFPKQFSNTEVEIGEFAFRGCAGLSMVSSGSETGNSNFVRTIGEGAFEGCVNLTRAYVLDQCLTEIGDGAFKDCTSLSNIMFSYSFTGGAQLVLGEKVFENTIAPSLSLPQNLMTVTGTTFYGMNNLREITIEEHNSYYLSEDGVLYTKGAENKRGSRLIAFPSAKEPEEGSFQIPYGVTEFDENAFYNCRGLNTLIFPSNVYTLKENVVKDCPYMKNIYVYSGFPDLVKTGGSFDAIFSGCGYSTQSVTIHTGKDTQAWQFAKEQNYTARALYDPADFTFEDAGEGKIITAFRYSPEYKDIVIPDVIAENGQKKLVTGVASGALAKPGLTSVMFLAHMKDVDTDAFRIVPDPDDITQDTNAESLKNIYIEDGNENLASIDGVLYQMSLGKITGLLYYPIGRTETEFNAPQELVYLPPNVFRGAANLKKIYIYDNIQGIGSRNFGAYQESSAFAGCSSLVAVELVPVDDEQKRTKYYGSDKGVLYAREGNTLTALLYYPKGERKPADTSYSAISYEVVNGCTRIMDMKNCIYLKNVRIPASVTTIDASAFEGSIELNSVTFEGSGIEAVGDEAFKDTKIAAISLPDSVKTIGARAFYNCTSLRKVQIAGNSLIRIGDEAFYGSRNIRDITIASTGTRQSGEVEIGQNAFRGLTRLETLEITNLKSIGIGANAFAYNTSLKSASFEESNIYRMDSGAFMGCVLLEEIDLDDSSSLITIGDNAFKECSSLEEAELPLNLMNIGVRAFENCVLLDEVNFDELRSLTVIGEYAFRNCGFSTVSFRDGLRTIGGDAFQNCSMLTAVYVPGTVQIADTDLNPFTGIGAQLTLYGPSGSDMEQYAASHNLRFVAGNIPDIKINISQTKASLYDTGITSLQLTATTQPENEEVIWISSNPSVAFVEDRYSGLVTAVSAGEAKIYAICTGSGQKAVCDITVIKTEVVIPEESRVINLKEKIQIGAYSVPLRNITYSSSNKKVATVNKSGIVTARGVGPVTISATAGEGETLRSDMISITVVKPTISLDKKKIVLNEKGDDEMRSEELVVSHFGAYDSVTWKSSNPRIAVVSGDNESAVVTAVRAGSVTITAECNGKKARCKVRVKPVYTRLNKSAETLYIGGTSYETLKLKAKVAGMSKDVEWESNHPEYAYVDDRGVVTAQSHGTAVITATANGVTAQCTVRVMDSTITILDKEGAELKPCAILMNSTGNNKDRLSARIVGRDKKVTWSSLANDIVKINNKGYLTGRNAGETEVVASVNGVESYCTVTVVDTKTELDYDNITLSLSGENGDPKMRTLTVTIEGADLRKNVKWETSNGDVAQITSCDTIARESEVTSQYGGVATANITALKAGKAVISVTANGVTAKCIVQVRNE